MSTRPSTGRSPAAPPPETAPAPPAGAETHDWKHIASTPEFQRLHASRRRFTAIGMTIETGAVVLVMALLGFAPDAMGEPAIGSITWALLIGTGLVVLTFLMAVLYARKARGWEEMAAAAIEHAEQKGERTGRFGR